jgi:hypothetical protein
MGRNTEGQLGDGTYNSINAPKQIIATSVSKVAAGSLHSLVIKSDGSLWGMGEDAYSQLGFASGVDNPKTPTKVLASGVTSVAGGGDNSLLLKTDGSAWLMGRAADNQDYLMRKILASNVVALAAGGDPSGDRYTLFAKSDGTLWTMGNNTYGQLGDGFNSDSINPEQVFEVLPKNPTSGLTSTRGSHWNEKHEETDEKKVHGRVQGQGGCGGSQSAGDGQSDRGAIRVASTPGRAMEEAASAGGADCFRGWSQFGRRRGGVS